jgi:hypothetical protein
VAIGWFFQLVREFMCQTFDFSTVVPSKFSAVRVFYRSVRLCCQPVRVFCGPVRVFPRPVRIVFTPVLQIGHLVGVFRPPATSANRLPGHFFRLVRVPHQLPFMTNRLPDRSNWLPSPSNHVPTA